MSTTAVPPRQLHVAPEQYNSFKWWSPTRNTHTTLQLQWQLMAPKGTKELRKNSPHSLVVVAVVGGAGKHTHTHTQLFEIHVNRAHKM